MSTVVFSVLALGVMAILFGFGLGYAGEKFHVEEDPKISKIRERLPGANCGGCGFAGCELLAQTIYKGSAKPNDCPVVSDDNLKEIGSIMGVTVEAAGQRKKAFIHCAGNNTNSGFKYTYHGLNDCTAAMQLADGGCKTCVYGCLGGGSCAEVCKFGAVSIINGLATVDNIKCTGCGVCVSHCPKKLIQMVPESASVKVACFSNETGRVVRKACEAGCIACGLCAKTCGFGAVTVIDNLAAIDYSKCTMCGECAKKCPTKAIIS